VKVEAEIPDSSLVFCKKICNIMNTQLDSFLTTRAVFIIVRLLDFESTKKLVMPVLISKKKDILKLRKEQPNSEGVKLVASKL
jgi:hypothetical protein